MSGRTKGRTKQEESKHPDDHPCLEWFRWFVTNCLRTRGGASKRELLLAMRAVLDAALEAPSRGRPGTHKLHPRPRKT